MSAFSPDVPDLPGVPPINRGPGASSDFGDGDDTLSSDNSDVVAAAPVVWGVFDDGDADVLVPDSILSVEFDKEYRVPDYPVEEGGFQSYNKVATPYHARVTMTKGGSQEEREDFLSAVEDITASLDLYKIATPERVYENANVIRYDYRRSSERGVTLITVELEIIEVRNTAVTAFTKSKDPSGADAVNGGSVQPMTPTQAQTPTGDPE